MADKPKDNIWLAAFFAAANAVMIAVMSLLAKLLSNGLDPVQITFVRNAISLIALVVWLCMARQLLSVKTKRPWAHFFRSLVGTSGLTMGMWALSILSLTETSVLMFTAPLFTLVLSVIFLKEKVGIFRISAVTIGFAGILIVLNPFDGAIDMPIIGVIAGLAWGLNYGIVDILLRWMGDTEKSSTTTFYFTVMGVLVTAPWLPFSDTSAIEFTPYFFAIASTFGLSGLVALLFKSQAYRLGDASIVAPIMYTTIIWAAVFDYLFWQKIPAWNVFVGALIIVSANLFILYRENKLKAQGK